jgi:hypothetical protein
VALIRAVGKSRRIYNIACRRHKIWLMAPGRIPAQSHTWLGFNSFAGGKDTRQFTAVGEDTINPGALSCGVAEGNVRRGK